MKRPLAWLCLFSDVVTSFSRVLRNGTFMTVTLAGVCLWFLMVSYLIQTPKYFELQYRMAAFKANLVVGEYMHHTYSAKKAGEAICWGIASANKAAFGITLKSQSGSCWPGPKRFNYS